MGRSALCFPLYSGTKARFHYPYHRSVTNSASAYGGSPTYNRLKREGEINYYSTKPGIGGV